MSMLLLAFGAAMTMGSAGWGAVAEAADATAATRIAATVQVVAALVALAWKPDGGGEADGQSFAQSWPQPDVSGTVDPGHGPVMVTIEYVISPERRPEFLEAIAALGRHRQAEGSVCWSLHERGRDPNRLVETNELATWGEHLLQRDRGSRASADLEEVVRACLRPETDPVVSHWLGATPAARTPHGQNTLQRLLGRM